MITIDERIVGAYDGLSPQERRAADALLDHLPDLGTYRAAELAGLAGVSRATMSRFVRRLGYDDFEELREDLRRQRSAGVPVQVVPVAGLQERLAAETEALRAAFAGIAEADLDAAATVVASAHRVVVVGLRSSHPVALHLRQQLAQARPDVRLAPQPGQSLAEDLVGLGPSDVVILVASRRRPEGLDAVLDLLVDQRVRVVLLADPSARSLAGRASWWFTCPLATPGAFDSYAATMAICSLLADRVGERAESAADRARRIATAYRSIGEVEDV